MKRTAVILVLAASSGFVLFVGLLILGERQPIAVQRALIPAPSSKATPAPTETRDAFGDEIGLSIGSLLSGPKHFPTATTFRWMLYGLSRREVFYRWLPTSYWERAAAHYLPIPRPDPRPHPSGLSWAVIGTAPPPSYRDLPSEEDTPPKFPAGTQHWMALQTFPPLEGSCVHFPPLTSGDPDAIPVLVELLKSRKGRVRAVAFWELGHLGPRAKAAVPALRQLLSSKKPGVRQEAEEALHAIEPEPE